MEQTPYLYERETAYFGIPPVQFTDALIDGVNQHVCDSLDKMQEWADEQLGECAENEEVFPGGRLRVVTNLLLWLLRPNPSPDLILILPLSLSCLYCPNTHLSFSLTNPSRPPPPARLQGMQKAASLLESAVDKSFDRWELYFLRMLVPLPAEVQLDYEKWCQHACATV